MKVTHVFTALAAADHTAALRSYARLFGHEPDGNRIKFFEDPGT